MTLTCRIAYLIEEAGIPADRILAVTFTLKAAREMEERLRSLLKASVGGAAVRVRTFHALGAELLRQSGSALGVPENFFVLDSRDQEVLLRRALTNLTQREALVLLERISLEKKEPPIPGGRRRGIRRSRIVSRVSCLPEGPGAEAGSGF